MHLPQTLSSAKMAQTIFRYCSPNLCKQNYLFGKLPFYKIQVNHFMAREELSGAILNSDIPFFSLTDC